MQPIYCGNNLADLRLRNGEYTLGTRYNCLKKGIGRGLRLPIDPSYSGEYEKIDTRKIYCGNNENLPADYDYMGNLPQCLQIGVGIGKRINGIRGNRENEVTVRNTFRKKILFYFLLLIILSGGIFSLLYFLKPSFIMKKSEESNTGELTIDWKNFGILYGIIVFILILVLYKIFW